MWYLMFDTIIIKWIAAALLAAAFSAGIYVGYSHIKQIGYNEAEAKYTLIIKQYETDVNKKIDSIVTMSNNLATINQANNEQLAVDVASILSKVKGKQLVVVKNGECVPSQTFSDSFGQINKQINLNMKGSQK